MPGWLKTTLKTIGYIGFFLVALVCFTYLTLPLDTLRDFLVRKASDEYNADLEITHLSMWGASGIEVQGLTLTPRPTVEEVEALREAQEARKAWMARKQAKEGATDEAAGEAAAPTAPEAPGATGKIAGAEPRKPGVDADEEAPPLPTGPQPVFIEMLRGSVAPFKLISDLMDGQVFNEGFEGHLEAGLLNGEITAELTRNPEQVNLTAQVTGIDLRQLSVLKRLLPVPVTADVGAEASLELPLDDKGKMQLANLEGHIAVNLSGGVLGPGQVEIKRVGLVDVPRVQVNALTGRVKFEKRKAEFEDFTFRGPDVDGELSGYVQLANQFDGWRPYAHLRFKLSEPFLEKEKAVRILVESTPDLKRAVDSDGYIGYRISLKRDVRTREERLSFEPSRSNPYGARKGRTAATDRPAAATKPSMIRTQPGRVRPDRKPPARRFDLDRTVKDKVAAPEPEPEAHEGAAGEGGAEAEAEHEADHEDAVEADHPDAGAAKGEGEGDEE